MGFVNREFRLLWPSCLMAFVHTYPIALKHNLLGGQKGLLPLFSLVENLVGSNSVLHQFSKWMGRVEDCYLTVMLCHLFPFLLDTQILGKQESNVKRKAELPEPMQENSKRKKTLGSSLDRDDSTLVTDNPSSFCGEVISQQENPTVSLPFSSNVDSDSNTCMQSNEDSEVLCPTSYNIENETSFSAGSVREDGFLCDPPDLEEIIKDEKIERLKLLLKKQEAALEEMRKKLQES